jgi:hypothetical protein
MSDGGRECVREERESGREGRKTRVSVRIGECVFEESARGGK